VISSICGKGSFRVGALPPEAAGLKETLAEPFALCPPGLPFGTVVILAIAGATVAGSTCCGMIRLGAGTRSRSQRNPVCVGRMEKDGSERRRKHEWQPFLSREGRVVGAAERTKKTETWSSKNVPLLSETRGPKKEAFLCRQVILCRLQAKRHRRPFWNVGPLMVEGDVCDPTYRGSVRSIEVDGSPRGLAYIHGGTLTH
jgi:hypothetical protein